MAKAIEKLSIELQFKDSGSQAVIEKLRGSLKRLEMGASGVRPNIRGLRNEIIAQGKASVKTVSNINAQIAALRGLRDEAKIGGKAFQQLTKDIDGLNAKLGKAQSRGGMGARRATQAAGAVISGGIFGGPEGAIGGLAGLAAGGVEGAYAGAAIGAAVGGARQAIADTAVYAAEINKLRIALEGVAPNQQDYNVALQASAQATRELNVPQEQSMRGITRLTAAVVGAEGPVEDAVTTFKNVTAAIKATGGSSEDVQGAITAMVQVFSKGKVSAEELSGQLGERLPGAVTLFAKANKMTLPELQENLKKGTVGLNELMNFIRQLGVEFNGTAQQMASSNEEAGARLQVAFDEMKLGVGESLMETGAGIQNTLGEFVKTTTPAVVGAAQLLVGALKPVVDNLDLLLVSLAGLAAGGTVAAIITNFAAIKTALIGIGTAASALLLNPIFAGAAAVAGIVAGIYAITKALRDQRSEIDKLRGVDPNKAVADYTNEERLLAIRKAKNKISRLKRKRAVLVQAGESEGGFDTTEIDSQIATAQARLTQVTAPVARKSTKPPQYTSPKAAGAGAGTGSTVKGRTAATQEMVNLTGRLASQADALTERERIGLNHAIARMKILQDGTLPATDRQVQLNNALVRFKTQIANLDKREASALARALSTKEKFEALEARALGKSQALTAEQMNQLKVREKIVQLQQQYGPALETAGMDPEEVKQRIKAIAEALVDTTEKANDFKTTFTEGLESIMNVGPKLAGTALSAIGSVTDGLIEMITTGKANFKEMTASILKDIAKIMMQAAIAGAVKSLFGLADGGVVQGGRIQPYAKGGVVTGPTTFPMAGGDIGLMGEAGPEAIMPLKRSSSGRLGVEVASEGGARDAMNRYSRRASAAGGPTESEDSSQGGGTAVATPIDVRYTVERINSVDYVTADQFQSGMQQAAAQGAKQGEQQTLKRLQMSGSTRKRIGL